MKLNGKQVISLKNIYELKPHIDNNIVFCCNKSDVVKTYSKKLEALDRVETAVKVKLKKAMMIIYISSIFLKEIKILSSKLKLHKYEFANGIKEILAKLYNGITFFLEELLQKTKITRTFKAFFTLMIVRIFFAILKNGESLFSKDRVSPKSQLITF
jgi:dipeptide/tripeptide permease